MAQWVVVDCHSVTIRATKAGVDVQIEVLLVIHRSSTSNSVRHGY